MAEKVIIRKNEIDDAFYKESEQNLILNKKREIYNTYKKEIDLASTNNSVPVDVIVSFIFIESSGNEKVKSSAGAYGLMQITKPTAIETILREIRNDRVTAKDKEVLFKFFPGSKYEKLKTAAKNYNISPIKDFFTDELMFDKLFNIYIGTMYISQLIDYFKEPDGSIPMFKVIVAYNSGFFSKYTKIAKQTKTAKELIDKIPKETANYIKKLVGNNGVLGISNYA